MTEEEKLELAKDEYKEAVKEFAQTCAHVLRSIERLNLPEASALYDEIEATLDLLNEDDL